MITLGETYKDSMTDFMGAATARAEYVYGVPRVELSAPVQADGKPIDPQWFDEGRLRLPDGSPLPPAPGSITAGG